MSIPNPPSADDVFNAQLAEEMVKRTARLQDTTIDIAVRVKEARDFLAWSAAHVRGAWIQWGEEATKACVDLVQTRMSIDRETKAVLAAGKDLRDFFLSPEYAAGHARMKEMIEMLERFEVLRQAGVMDAFADFILKVSCK